MICKHFFEFLLELAFAFALGALLGMGICVLAACLDDAWRALWRWWKGKSTSLDVGKPSPGPSGHPLPSDGRGASRRRGEGNDDNDLDGGAGGAPVCP